MYSIINAYLVRENVLVTSKKTGCREEMLMLWQLTFVKLLPPVHLNKVLSLFLIQLTYSALPVNMFVLIFMRTDKPLLSSTVQANLLCFHASFLGGSGRSDC